MPSSPVLGDVITPSCFVVGATEPTYVRSGRLEPIVILGVAVAFLNLAFELVASAIDGGQISSVSLPHFSFGLAQSCASSTELTVEVSPARWHHQLSEGGRPQT
jgi:hypothetical protein